MRLVSFNPYRTFGLPGVQYLKPEELFRRRELLEAADWVLFPETWQVNTLLYGLKRRIFPSPNTFHLGYDKIEMTRAFWSVAEAHVPQTAILPSNANALAEIRETFELPLIVKDVRSSMGRGVYLVTEWAQLRELAAQLSVLYVQEYLTIERDLRVVVVGDRVVGSYWRRACEGEFRNNVARGAELEFDPPPQAALDLVARVAATLGIDHAGFDVALVDGHPYLFEFNPLFGTEGLKRLGADLPTTILDYLHRQTECPPEAPQRPPLQRAV